MVAVVENKMDQIASACVRHGVKRLFVFGSALRDDFRPGESDIDLLVEFSATDPFALADAYFGLFDDLRAVLDGPVDLVMADAVKNRYVLEDIERSKQVLYAA